MTPDDRVAVLDENGMRQAVRSLVRCDQALGAIVSEYGQPPFWRRPTGWQTLARIVLEQQVSLASAAATWKRLRTKITPLSAAKLARCGPEALRELGLTRQKARYLHELASLVSRRELSLARLAYLDDDSAREQLMSLIGVGRWTADCYLLLALCRPDIWPPGDLALRRAIQQRYALSSAAARRRLVDRWKPWRSVAARLLWHDYLSKRNNSAITG